VVLDGTARPELHRPPAGPPGLTDVLAAHIAPLAQIYAASSKGAGRYGPAAVDLPRFNRTVGVAEVVGALDEVGAVVVERYLDDDAVAQLRDELTPVLDATPRGRNDFEGFGTRRVYALFAKVRGFDGPATDPLVTGVVDAVLGPCQLCAPVAIDIGPGEVAQGLHRDDSVYPLGWPHPPVVLNTMWALDDFTAANGATRLIPASHRQPPSEPPDPSEVIIAEMPAGSVMFYVGTLWHGGGANATDTPRLGVILEYVASWLRAQENHVLAVPADVVRTLPERLQELLGYNIYPPFLGYVDGRHPRRVLES
jgi:ectoine hydroxylase-related dioxygenase (phytanoyl-CoA dioxygenase family)